MVDDENTERGVMVECDSSIIEGDAAEPFRLYMRKAKGWENDEGTLIIKLTPRRKTSWFLK
jgi:hypothetical protein